MSGRPLVWFDQQESGVEERVLWDLLRRHGFVEGELVACDAQTHQRIEALASDLMEEIAFSEVERAASRPLSDAELDEEESDPS